MPYLASLARDVRLAVRGLFHEKGFTATVLATLALCLGANVVIFTVVHSVLLKPLPFPEPGRLITLVNSYPKAGVERAGASIPNYYDRRGHLPAVSAIAEVRSLTAIVGGNGAPERVAMDQVTPSFFGVLEVKPQVGRFFTEKEDEYGRSDVVVLTDGLWRERFHADPGVIGRTMRINDVPTTIIGVLPRGFHYLSDRARLWMPLASSAKDRSPQSRHSNNESMIGRLEPGATLAEAQAQMNALNLQLLASDPFAKDVAAAGFHTLVLGLHADHVARIRPTLVLLQAAVLFLLLIGGVNLVNLLVVRATARSRELAIRQVLGASGGRVAAQLITETMVLALAGGVLGLGVGAGGLQALSLLGVNHLPLGSTISFDLPVAAIALAGTAVVGLLLALPVVWINRHRDLAPVLNTESRGGTTTRATHRLRHALIVAQIALAFILLSGAGLLGLSFSRVLAVAPGFQETHLLTGQVALPWTNYRHDRDRLNFATRLLAELRALPGVKAAALSNGVPFTNEISDNATFVEGYNPPPGGSIRAYYSSRVSGGYFATLGIPLVAGRFLTSDDMHSDRRVCVVDRDFARYYWPHGSALGHRVYDRPPTMKGAHLITIVGVVGNVKQNDLADQAAKGAVYYPISATSAPLAMYVVLRTVQAPEAAASALRQAVRRIDPQLPVSGVETMTTRVSNSLQSRRSPLLLAGIFALVALILAAIGIYGVLAYAVAQRRREIGVRMALGAQPEKILRQFLGLGTRLLLVGIIPGLAGSWFVGRAMGGMLFGVSPANVEVLVATALVLAAVVLLASLLPSRRAARVDPMQALRSD